MSDISFNAGKITEQTNSLVEAFSDLLIKNGMEEKSNEVKKLIEQFYSDDTIKIAFVGQFSSGKSSIISALTGNKAIKIGSDVTTDCVENYRWGKFFLTDTPGLQNNQIHDVLAEEAIKQSDLIIYCITSELFSKNTRDDFINLAFEKGYKSKMVLVVNKINSEYTENIDELLQIYENQIIKDLRPNAFDEIQHCYIDVKDYLDGKEENDDELIAESRFNVFIDFLNEFLNKKGLLLKLSTPITSIRNIICDTFVDTTDDVEEKNKRTFLARMNRMIDKLKSNAIRDWNYIVTNEVYSLIDNGFDLSNKIGEEEFDFELKINKIVDETCQSISIQLTEFSDKCIETLESEIEDIFQSKVGKFVLSAGDSNVSYSNDTPKNKNEIKEGANQVVNQMGELSSKAALKIKPEKLYNVVEKVGHNVFKIKFKPYGILKAAEKLGKAIKFMGPATEVLGLFMDIKTTVDESKEAKELMKNRREAKDAVKTCAEEIRTGYNEQRTVFIAETYNPIYEEINKMQNDMVKQSNDKIDFNQDLMNIKSSFDKLYESVVTMN